MKYPRTFCYYGRMKKTTRLVLLALISAAAAFLGACQSASLVPADSRSLAAVPVVLQANPDILGGLVGREAVGSLPAPHPLGGTAQRAQLDQRAYLIWKHSENS